MTEYPTAMQPERVGEYPAHSAAGGGYVWDEVLEYRVWCSPLRGSEDRADGSDYFFAFATLDEAAQASERLDGAEAPIALILQREYIDEPTSGDYRHVRDERLTEWPIELLRRPRRDDRTIHDFLAPDAPDNRLEILRGEAQRP